MPKHGATDAGQPDQHANEIAGGTCTQAPPHSVPTGGACCHIAMAQHVAPPDKAHTTREANYLPPQQYRSPAPTQQQQARAARCDCCNRGCHGGWRDPPQQRHRSNQGAKGCRLQDPPSKLAMLQSMLAMRNTKPDRQAGHSPVDAAASARPPPTTHGHGGGRCQTATPCEGNWTPRTPPATSSSTPAPATEPQHRITCWQQGLCAAESPPSKDRVHTTHRAESETQVLRHAPHTPAEPRLPQTHYGKDKGAVRVDPSAQQSGALQRQKQHHPK
jgi:hypothetical protein